MKICFRSPATQILAAGATSAAATGRDAELGKAAPVSRGGWLQERHLAPPADEFRPHMLIFEASAGSEFWPHPVRPARLQAAAKGATSMEVVYEKATS
jgi:hypothetical protein